MTLLHPPANYCPLFPRSHVQWWVLPVPDVRWKCSSLLGPAGAIPGHGPATGPLLHQLLPQQLPDRPTVWREVLSRDVPPGSTVRMQVHKCVMVCEGVDTYTVHRIYAYTHREEWWVDKCSCWWSPVCSPSCQMCGAGLLGRERRGPGAHHHSWQSHVHRHLVQGEHTLTDSPQQLQESFSSKCVTAS